MQVFIGKLDAPAVCRLVHYDVPNSANLPMGSGPMTHVADLMPLPIGEPGGDSFILSTMLPLLAEGLRLMVSRFPSTALLPVWATIPEELVNHMKPRFRGNGPRKVQSLGRIIWMPRLSDAADDIANMAQPFTDIQTGDISTILPLYQEFYSPQFSEEDLLGLF